MATSLQYIPFSRLILFCVGIFLLASDVTAAKKRKCKVRKGYDIDPGSVPFFGYSANHDMAPVALKYDPMTKITDKIGKECKKACSQENNCGAWRTVTNGNSAGATAICSLYKKGSFAITKSDGCGTAECRVGECL